jgi:hypothetical protein
VGHAAGEQSHRLHLLRLPELRLELQLVGHVARVHDHAADRGIRASVGERDDEAPRAAVLRHAAHRARHGESLAPRELGEPRPRVEDADERVVVLDEGAEARLARAALGVRALGLGDVLARQQHDRRPVARLHGAPRVAHAAPRAVAAERPPLPGDGAAGLRQAPREEGPHRLPPVFGNEGEHALPDELVRGAAEQRGA